MTVSTIPLTPTLLDTNCFNTDLVFSNAGTNGYIWQQGVHITGTIGTPNDGLAGMFHISNNNDTVDATTSGPGSMEVFSIYHQVSAGHSGRRHNIFSRLECKGTPVNTTTPAYASGIFECDSQVNLGGTTGVFTNYKGQVFGGNSNVNISNSATFVNNMAAHEFNTSIEAGASCAAKLGISIVKGSVDTARGVYEDSGILFQDQPGAGATWRQGISFGGYYGAWPFGTDSTLIGAQIQQVGGSSSPVALYGVDFTVVTFTTGGAPYLAPLITPASAAATGKQGSICWDSNFIYVCVATNTWKRTAIATW